MGTSVAHVTDPASKLKNQPESCHLTYTYRDLCVCVCMRVLVRAHTQCSACVLDIAIAIYSPIMKLTNNWTY